MSATRFTLSFFIGMLLAAGCSRAFGNGYTPADPGLQQSQAQTQWQNDQQSQGQSSTGIAGNFNPVTSQSTAAEGGHASAGGGNANINDADRNTTKALALGLGSFAMAPLPPGLCTASDPVYERIAVPLLFDISRQKANSICPKVLMRDYFVSICHFADARQLDKAIVTEMYPGFQHDDAIDKSYLNLNRDQCRKVKEFDTNKVIDEAPPAAGVKQVAERLAPKKACANPKRYDVPCARPGGIRKDDGCCYYGCAGT